MNNIKRIEVNGKTYTLTARRSIIFSMAKLSPKVLQIMSKDKQASKDEESELNLSVSEILYDNMNVVFYEMIRIAHPDISLNKSNEIYYDFCREYNDVDEKLLNLITSVFSDGIPREQKKNLDW